MATSSDPPPRGNGFSSEQVGCHLVSFYRLFAPSLPPGGYLLSLVLTIPISILELELIQTQMAQKPMLRAEVYAHAMRASQNRKKEVRREKKV